MHKLPTTKTWQSVRSVADNEVTARSLFAACRRSRTFREFANFRENSGVPLKKGRETRLNRQYWANMEWWVQFDNFCVRKYAFSQLFSEQNIILGACELRYSSTTFFGVPVFFCLSWLFRVIWGQNWSLFTLYKSCAFDQYRLHFCRFRRSCFFLMPNFWQKTHENSRLRKMLWRHSVLLCAEVTRHVRRSKTCLKKVKKNLGGNEDK